MRGFHHRGIILTIGLLSALQSGCDPIYRVQQPVVAAVKSRDSGLPAVGVLIDCCFACVGDEWEDEALSEAECLERFGGESQATDESGQVTLPIDSYIVCGGLVPGLIPGPDLTADRVTGEILLLSLIGPEGRDVLHVRAIAEQVVVGADYEVLLCSIGPPKQLPLSATSEPSSEPAPER